MNWMEGQKERRKRMREGGKKGGRKEISWEGQEKVKEGGNKSGKTGKSCVTSYLLSCSRLRFHSHCGDPGGD